MKLFAVTVLYVKTDGTDCNAVAMVSAVDAWDAIDAAEAGVRALPHCREVKGSTCHELADLAGGDNAQATTHATHTTLN